MRRFLLLLSIVSLVFVNVSNATVRRVKGESPSILPAEQTAVNFLQRMAPVWGWDAKQLIPLGRVPITSRHLVVFGQNVHGYPVYGNSIKVELDGSGRVTHVWGEPQSGLTVPQQQPQPSELAILAAENALDVILPLDREPTLVVLPWKPARLAYLVHAWVGFKKYNVLVDAFTLNVLLIDRQWFSAQGRVYSIDPARTPDTIDVELPNLLNNGKLEGRAGHVYNCLRASSMQGMPDPENMEVEEIPPSEGENFLYDPVLTLAYDDYAGAVNLYWHVDRMDSHFRDLSYVPPVPVKIVANVHSESNGNKSPMDNAYYTPLSNGNDGLFVGQGTNVDLAYGGDVVMHEMTHSVVAHTSIDLGVQQADQYGLNRMPLGLHEGFADYFPASLNNSPIIGAYALEQIQPGASRDLSNNTKVCPDDMVGEEHMDGEIIGAFTWQVREQLGAELADAAIFAAMARLTGSVTFKDFADALLAVLEEMQNGGTITENQLNTVRSVAQDKGLDICGRWVPLDEPRRVTTLGLDMIGQAMGGDCQQLRSMLGYMGIDMTGLFQYKLTVPSDATSIQLTFTFTPMGGNDLMYNLYARTGEMVLFDLVNVYGDMLMPKVQTYDRSWPASSLQSLTDRTTVVTWSVQDDPPLPVGQDIYFALTHANCPVAYLDVTADISTDPIVDPDAGPDADTDAGEEEDADAQTPHPKSKKDGCSCTTGTTGSSSTLPFFVLFGFVFLVLRRRRA